MSETSAAATRGEVILYLTKESVMAFAATVESRHSLGCCKGLLQLLVQGSMASICAGKTTKLAGAAGFAG